MRRLSFTSIVIALVILVLVFGAGYLGLQGLAAGSAGSDLISWSVVDGTFLMWLVPLATLILLVLGTAWVWQSLGGPKRTSSPERCVSCGHPIRHDWKICPYCAASLGK
jgi:H+/Cl- antiporter ClcA